MKGHEEGYIELGKHVVDKELLDKNGRRAGKVDDLLIEVPEPSVDSSYPLPEVVAVICGPFALSQNLPRPLQWLARQVYRLLGLPSPRPVEIPWSKVAALDVVVHADIDRRQAGLLALEDAVYRRWIGRLPGA